MWFYAGPNDSEELRLSLELAVSDYKPELAGPTGEASSSVTRPGKQLLWSLLYPGAIDWGTVTVRERVEASTISTGSTGGALTEL